MNWMFDIWNVTSFEMYATEAGHIGVLVNGLHIVVPYTPHKMFYDPNTLRLAIRVEEN